MAKPRKTVRRNVEAQERTVSALYQLLRDHADTTTYPHHCESSGGLTLNTNTIGKALAEILDAFGYGVTEIQ